MSPDTIAILVQFHVLGKIPIVSGNKDAYCGDDGEELCGGYSLTLAEGKARKAARMDLPWLPRSNNHPSQAQPSSNAEHRNAER